MRPKRLPQGILTTLLLAAIVPAAACGGNGAATHSSPTATPEQTATPVHTTPTPTPGHPHQLTGAGKVQLCTGEEF